MLWLALHFPLLTLEALPLRSSPSAVSGHGRILAADAVAASAGVETGQKRSTALGLLPGLRVFERDRARESRALADLACWAGRFTPTLSLVPPAGLLLEIGACRRLFGGLQAIVDAVLEGCRQQGWTVDWALAPTPLGACWLARAGASCMLEREAELADALAGLACSVPDWPADIVARLESFGMLQLGDLMRYPPAGLRQRIGNPAMDALLRAQGALPDPQALFVFPEHFTLRLDLPSRVEFAEGLAFAAQRLFFSLAGWLQVRQLVLQACTLQLLHDNGSVSHLPLRFGEACADESRFMRLLREHLARLRLDAPVIGLQLDADDVLPCPSASASLFAQATTGEGAAACIERLRARLGREAVQRLGMHADHRPECASRMRDPTLPADAGEAVGAGARPLCLLPVPQLLVEHADGPHWQGALQFLSRGERLESGWWDSGEPDAPGDIRRDYFIVRNRHGQTGWIFRDADAWYLQGIFA